MASVQSRRKTLPVARWLGLHRWTLAVTALVILAALLRLYRLTDHGLWVDEIFTALFSSPDKSLVEVARGPLNSPLATPPLWFFISHAFMKFFGTGETAVRLPSLVAGALGVIVIYILGASMFGRRVGLVAALLLALSPAHLFVSREARFYAAIVLFSMLTIYCLHQGMTSYRTRWWVGFAVATLCNLYIHLTSFFVLAAETAFVCVLLLHHWHALRRRRGQGHGPENSVLPPASRRLFPPPYRAFLASLAVIALCYLPMAGYLLTGSLGERGFGSPDTTQGLDLSLNYFLSLLSSFGAGTGPALPLYAAAALLGLWRAGQTRPRLALLFLIMAILPFGLVLLVQPKHWFAAKYVMFLLPVYLLSISLGIVYLAECVAALLRGRVAFRRSGPVPHLAFALLVALYGSLSWFALDSAYQKHDDHWRSIGRLLTANVQERDAVVVLPTVLRTMTASEIMAYYGPTASDATILTLDSAVEPATVLGQYRRVWLVIDHRSDPAVVERLAAWLDTQPHVDLAVDSDAVVVYLGQSASSQTLVQEVGDLAQIDVMTYASTSQGDIVARR